MGWFMDGEMILSLPVIIIAGIIIAAGYIILTRVSDKKWGYTEKREKELEDSDVNEVFSRSKKHW